MRHYCKQQETQRLTEPPDINRPETVTVITESLGHTFRPTQLYLDTVGNRLPLVEIQWNGQDQFCVSLSLSHANMFGTAQIKTDRTIPVP